MSETLDAAAQAGTADDEVPAIAPEAQVEGDEDGAETTAEQELIEEIELTFGAKTLKVAKGAIPDDVRTELEDFTRNIQGDYTRKTQEVAEQRKAVEGERELFQKLRTLQGEALAAFSAGQRVAAELQRLDAVNLDALWQSNPDQARRVSDARSAAQAEFQRHVETVSRHEASMAAEEQQAIAKLVDAGRAEMARTVKGFDEAGERELVAYAVRNGIPEQDAKNWPLNPKTAALVWKAMQLDKINAKTKAAVAAPPPAPPTEPVRAVSGKSSASPKNPETMSMDEYVRWRNSQSARRR
jgi:hypothetical protein